MYICDSTFKSANFQLKKSQTVKSNYFIVRPKVDQRAGLLSLAHLFHAYNL